MRVRHLLCCMLLLGVGFAQTKSAATNESTGTPLATAEHQVSGVQVNLLELKRTPGNTVTARWEYKNTTSERKQMTDERTGWMDPYRLAADAFLEDDINRIKYPVMRDTDRRPVAAKTGAPNTFIVLRPKQTLATWAKFQAPPENVNKITIVIPGVPPMEKVPIAPE